MKAKKKIKVKVKKKKATVTKVKVKRDARGWILPGERLNPLGKKKGTSFLDEFRLALRETEKKKRKSLLVHFCETAFTDKRVLVACVSKILPDLKAIAVFQPQEDEMSDEDAKSIQDKMRARFENPDAIKLKEENERLLKEIEELKRKK